MSENLAYTKFPRGKITLEQERCLQKNSVFLADNIECPEIVSMLYSVFVLDDNDKEKILGSDGHRLPRKEQSQRLLDVITMRSPVGFHAFLKALDDTGHAAAARKIRETLEEPPAETGNRSEEREHADHAQRSPSASPESLSEESDGAGGREAFRQEVTGLCERVVNIEKHLDVLSYRMTQIDGGQKEEVARLRQKLTEASSELRKLRRENDSLNSLVTEKSEQLRQASEKIAALERQLQAVEADNAQLHGKVAEQSQELQQMRLHAQQASEHISGLQAEVERQSQQQNAQRKELELLRKRSEAENKRVGDLQEFKKKSEQVLQSVARQFLAMQNEVQQLRDHVTNSRQGKSAAVSGVAKPSQAEQGDNAGPVRCAAKQQLFNFDRPATKQGNKPKPQVLHKAKK